MTEQQRNDLGSLCDWTLEQLEYASGQFSEARTVSENAEFQRKLTNVLQACDVLQTAIKEWGGWYPVPGAGPILPPETMRTDASY